MITDLQPCPHRIFEKHGTNDVEICCRFAVVEIGNVKPKLDKVIRISSEEKHKQMNDILSKIENEPLITTNRKVTLADIVARKDQKKSII